MKTLTLHSKIIDLQGEKISASENESVLEQLRSILALKDAGEITPVEAGTQIRKTAWKVAEDLRVNDLDLSSGSDQSIFESLPHLLKS